MTFLQGETSGGKIGYFNNYYYKRTKASQNISSLLQKLLFWI